MQVYTLNCAAQAIVRPVVGYRQVRSILEHAARSTASVDFGALQVLALADKGEICIMNKGAEGAEGADKSLRNTKA